MANLSKHGKSIGRIEYLTYNKEYFENGDILVNRGFGWKEYGKVKSGIDPQDVFNKKLEFRNKKHLENPLYAKFFHELHEMAGIKDRWKLVEAIKIMPDDPDGVWSEVCDGYGDNLSANISEVVSLCLMYKHLENAGVSWTKINDTI